MRHRDLQLQTVRLAQAYGAKTPFFIVAAVLVAYSVVAYLFLRDAPRARAGGSAYGLSQRRSGEPARPLRRRPDRE